MQRHGCQLLYDSALAALQAGSRGRPSAERSIVFESGDYTVDLVIHDSTDGVRYVHGQVVRDGSEPPERASVCGPDSREPVPTDELGQFAVSSITVDGSTAIAVTVGKDVLICTIPPEEER